MILTIVGARPQFVKAAVLSNAFKTIGVKEKIVHTGQHYDHKMSQVFFDELGLPGASINLNIGSGNHGSQTAAMLLGIEQIFLEQKNNISHLLVYGDTNSTLAGALAAVKLHIPIIHVEAGLRSFNKTMPEEINRILTDHVSDILFCSSEEGKMHLNKEGINSGVHVCGDIMQDAFNIYSLIAEEKLTLRDLLPPDIISNSYYLLTIHRPANTDVQENLQEILNGLAEIKIDVIWPIHPRVKGKINKLNIPDNVHIYEPFSYFEMLIILKGAIKVITDSGGLQKEAYWAKKPCITVRPETEWVETLQNNWNILSPACKNDLIAANNKEVDTTTWKQLYGDGKTAEKICDILVKIYNL